MNHRERIENALRFKATDRLPFGFWMHFPNEDRSPRRLAELTLALQTQFDLDFIKFTPYGLFSVVDWGVRLRVFEGFLDMPVQAEYPVTSIEDWGQLRPFGGDEGEYAVVLESQRIALSELTEDVPLVQTVFSPLSSCAKLAGEEMLLQHMDEAPEAVHTGLEIITETTRRFAGEAIRHGADGLFFATQMSNAHKLTAAHHAEFVKKYDLVVLEAVQKKSWFNILHLHGPDIMFDQVLDYPVQAFNWHDRECGPSLARLRSMTDKCLVGGIAQFSVLLNGSPEEVAAQVDDAWEQVEGRGLILAPGCIALPRSPKENLLQLRKSIEKTAGLL